MVRIRKEPKFNILRCCVWNPKVLCKKTLFSNFWAFLVIWASFTCYFWIRHLKIMPGTNFQIININASLWYSKMASFKKNEGILVPICNIHISLTIQVTRLKFGSFPYLYSVNLYAKFHGFLKTWVSSPYYLSLFDVEFPYVENTIGNLSKVMRAKFLGSNGLCCFINICKFGSFKIPFVMITSLPLLDFPFFLFYFDLYGKVEIDISIHQEKKDQF